MEKSKKQSTFLADAVLILIMVTFLSVVTYCALDLRKARDRDSKRVADLLSLKTAIEQSYKMNHAYPKTGYKNITLGIFMRELPADPLNNKEFHYDYLADGSSYVLLAKIEKPNLYAQNDKGKFNKKPLYYEIGSGPDWQSLIPKNLK